MIICYIFLYVRKVPSQYNVLRETTLKVENLSIVTAQKQTISDKHTQKTTLM